MKRPEPIAYPEYTVKNVATATATGVTFYPDGPGHQYRALLDSVYMIASSLSSAGEEVKKRLVVTRLGVETIQGYETAVYDVNLNEMSVGKFTARVNEFIAHEQAPDETLSADQETIGRTTVRLMGLLWQRLHTGLFQINPALAGLGTEGYNQALVDVANLSAGAGPRTGILNQAIQIVSEGPDFPLKTFFGPDYCISRIQARWNDGSTLPLLDVTWTTPKSFHQNPEDTSSPVLHSKAIMQVAQTVPNFLALYAVPLGHSPYATDAFRDDYVFPRLKNHMEFERGMHREVPST